MTGGKEREDKRDLYYLCDSKKESVRSFVLIILCMAGSFSCLAQGSTGNDFYSAFLSDLRNNNLSKGKIEIITPAQLDTLVNYVCYQTSLQQKQGFPGYRIRIFSDGSQSARQKMFAEKARFLKHFEQYDVYISYVAPYWKIYVGDFLTRSEALKAYEAIKKVYPYAFIVNDFVKISD